MTVCAAGSDKEEVKVHTQNQRLCQAIDRSADAIRQLREQTARIGEICDLVITTLQHGGKVLTAGNGGSAAEAMHMAEELTGRFRTNRRSLPGLALTADGTALTCIANDFGFDEVFSRQIEGLANSGDLLVLFSTSGQAPNLLRACEAASSSGMRTVALLGRDGGALAGKADLELCVPGEMTERIQEVHQVILHLILEEVERAFSE